MTATVPDALRAQRPDWGGAAAVTLLCLAIVAGPLMLGSVHAVTRLALEGLAVTAAVVWTASAKRPTWVLLAPIALALPTFVQLIPLQLGLLHTIAPLPADLWLTCTDAGVPRMASIAINPGAAVSGGARAVLGGTIVAMVADLGRRPAIRWAISITLALVGIVTWGLGIVYPSPGNSGILLGFISINGPFGDRGRTPIDPPVATSASGYPAWFTIGDERYLADEWVVGDGFGPYVISNHFAGALCLTLPVAAAVWMAMSSRRLPVFLRVGIAAVTLAAAVLTVVVAGSRAGTGALLLASLTVLSLTKDRGWTRTAFGCGAAACALGLLLFFSFFHTAWVGVETRFPAAMQPQVKKLVDDHRRLATQVAMRMFAGSPAFGTGVGSYGDLHPVILGNGEPWYFAHNDYAQLLGETGLFGSVVVAALCSAGIWAFLVWKRGWMPTRIIEAGPWAALAGVAAHSGFDCNLHVPANGLLACVVAGLALSSVPWPRVSDSSRPWLRVAAVVGCTAALVATGALLVRDGLSEMTQRRLRIVLVADRLVVPENKIPPTTSEFEATIAAGERMAYWDPWSAQLAALLGQANLHLSVRPLTIDDANARYKAAMMWFRRSRLNCPVCRGVAEPIPRVAPSKSLR